MEPEGLELIEVWWLDSERQGDGWRLKDDFADFAESEIQPCRSVGYLWVETEQFILLVANVSEHCINGNIKIPKAAITHRFGLGRG